MSRAIDLDGMDRAELERTRRKYALYARDVELLGEPDDGDDLEAIYDRLVAVHAAIRATEKIGMDELGRYLTDGADGSLRWEFPNGHHVSVIADPHTILRFEVLSTDPTDAPAGGIRSGLTTEQVEAKLADVFALPSGRPAPVVAVVTVDDRGRLTTDSTVTIDGVGWPVPEKAEQGGVMWWPRLRQVLTEQGWRVVGEFGEPRSTPDGRVVEVPVERIEGGEA